MATRKVPRKSGAAEFSGAFADLRSMLKKHAEKLVVTTDTATDFAVASKTRKDRSGRPLFLAGVQIKKSYVSYHLLPLYGMPSLLKLVPPDLKKRMQGKACFNFTQIEPAQLRELSSLTRTSIAKFRTVALPWEE